MRRLHHAQVIARHFDTAQLARRHRTVPAQVRHVAMVTAAVAGLEQMDGDPQGFGTVMGHGVGVGQFAFEEPLQLLIVGRGQLGIEQALLAAGRQQHGERRLPVIQRLYLGQLRGALGALTLPVAGAVQQQLPLQHPCPLPARLALVHPTRLPGVDQAQKLDGLVGPEQLRGDLIGQQAAEGPASQAVRPLRLHLADALDLRAGQGFQRVGLGLAQGKARHAVDREVAVQGAAQHREVEVHAAELVNQEQRRLAALGTHADQGLDVGVCAAVQVLRQGGHAGVLEQLGQRHRQPLLAQQADQADRQQRVAAQVEEAVMPPHPFDLQHRRPQRGQLPLQRRGRGLVQALQQVLGRRLRQRLAVDLAVVGQRQCIEPQPGRGQQGRGQHVGGQTRLQPTAHGADLQARVLDREPGDQTRRLARGKPLRHDHHLVDAGALGQVVFDLAQFDGSPVRYSRAPDRALKGSSRKRSAVSSGRFR